MLYTLFIKFFSTLFNRTIFSQELKKREKNSRAQGLLEREIFLCERLLLQNTSCRARVNLPPVFVVIA